MQSLRVLGVICVLFIAITTVTALNNSNDELTSDALIMEDEIEPVMIQLRRGTRSTSNNNDEENVSLLEVSKRKKVRRGWGISRAARNAKQVQQRLPAPRLTGAASTLTRANVRCVLCQFIVQKIQKELIPAAAPADAAAESFLEITTGSTVSASASAIVAADASADAEIALEATYPNQQGNPTAFDNGPDQSRQFRHDPILSKRPLEARFMQTNNRQRLSANAHKEYLALYTQVYASFEGLCSKKMPLAYLPYCNDMLQSYRFFAQGLSYGDRAEQICMNGNFCDHRAYVRTITHNAYQREPGDA